MIPKKYDAHEYDYPDFQPDQVLSADNLNHSFAFNEQQERLTRTNLLGIGITCGLKATRAADGKTVFISKGTGVTSHGYLIVHGKENSDESIQYKHYRSYNVLQDITYDVFVKDSKPKYPVWELIESGFSKAGDTELSTGFLSNKVCLLFYEMLEISAKNCDATSCDDKGKTVTITVRKLLVNIADADKIIADLNKLAGAKGSGDTFPGALDLVELRLPRFNVVATALVTTNDVYEAYQKVFTKKFVEDTGKAFIAAYDKFKDYLKDSSNPFASFNATFAFLHNGTILDNNLLHFQYYYDFFCDLLMAYDEWRLAANSLVAMCTPPEALFPRHLMLWNFAESETVKKSNYRNYFIPSPIISEHEHAYKEFKSLFQRLVRMVINVSMPNPVKFGSGQVDQNIRIIPSKLGTAPLGLRAIPYYYKPNDASNKLLDVWDYALTKRGRQTQILNYNPAYNLVDDFVKNPLKYDLEPYNFLRIEGHLGKTMSSVLFNLEKLRDDNRLPFQYVAVSVDGEEGDIDLSNYECYFSDLEAMFDALKAELACKLYKLLYCLYQLPNYVDAKNIAAPKESVSPPTRTTTKYTYGRNKGGDKISYTEKSLGQSYEGLYEVMSVQGKGYRTTVDTYVGIYQQANPTVTAEELAASNTLLDVLHNVVILRTGIDTTLSKFNADKMVDTVNLLKKSAAKMKGPSSTKLLRDILNANPCLDELFDVLCDILQFFAIYTEYLKRIEKLKLMVTLKEFVLSHPGIQHKGGVPVGGTFVVVYRNFFSDPKDTTKKLLAKLDEVDNPPDAASPPAAAPAPQKSKYKIISGVPAGQMTEMMKKVDEMAAKGSSKAEIEKKLGVLLEDVKVTGKFSNEINTWPDGIVVADFFLPYACCSDCAPIQFTVNIPPPKVIFNLDKSKFCSGDPNTYSFHAVPTGGKITSIQQASVVDNGDGTFAFLPSFVKIDAGKNNASVVYTYTVEDQMQSITITVDAVPEVVIVAQVDAANPLKVKFTYDKPGLVLAAKWNFGDLAGPVAANTSIELSPTHTYTKCGTYSVSVEVANGECSFTAPLLQLVVKDPDPVVITGFPAEVCRTAPDVQFTVKPSGGTFTGEGVSLVNLAAGTYKFAPAAVNMTGIARRTIAFIYTAPAGNSNPASNVVVNNTPAATFMITANQSAHSAVMNFKTMANTEKIKVDYTDGTPAEEFTVNYASDFNTPAHVFVGNGPFVVKATLINGSCTTPLIQQVGFQPVVEEVKKVCQPLSGPVVKFNEFRNPLLSKSPQFVEMYGTQRLAAVTDYFTKVNEAIKKNPSGVAVSFFADNPISLDWVTGLPVLSDIRSTNINSTVVNLPSFQLASIFMELITVVMCMGVKDLDGPTKKLLDALLTKMTDLRKLLIKDASGKTMIANLLKYLRDEVDLIANNKETLVKASYVEVLKNIIAMLAG